MTRGTTKTTSEFLLVSRGEDRSTRWTPFVCQTLCHYHLNFNSCSKNAKTMNVAARIDVSRMFLLRMTSDAGRRAANANAEMKIES